MWSHWFAKAARSLADKLSTEAVPRTRNEQELLEKEVDFLLAEEAARRIQPGLLVDQLDFPEFKADRPELRQALLNRLKALGRVPQVKE